MQTALLSRRPATAPCHHAPERWTEVDALVRDMLCSAATVAADAHSSQQVHALPRRPLTACAGLQPMALVMSGHGSRSDAHDDSDSDGASFDDDSEEAGPAVDVLRLGADADDGGAGSGNDAPLAVEELLTDSERLLLGGRLWGSSSSPTHATHGQPTKKASGTIGITSALSALPVMPQQKNNQGTTELPIIKAESLPKQCLFLGGRSRDNDSMRGRQKNCGNKVGMSSGRRGALAPGAARVQSHNSWMTFRPVRDTTCINRAAAKAAAAAAGSRGSAPSSSSGVVSSRPSEAAACDAVSRDSEEATRQAGGDVAPTMRTQPPPPAPAAVEGRAPMPQIHDAAPAEIPRRKGPKYRVAPGGSRPAKPSPAPPRQAGPEAAPPGGGFLVVEFRSEPRVVPAARHSHKDRRGSGSHARHQFRPGSRQWASERQALAAAAQ